MGYRTKVDRSKRWYLRRAPLQALFLVLDRCVGHRRASLESNRCLVRRRSVGGRSPRPVGRTPSSISKSDSSACWNAMARSRIILSKVLTTSGSSWLPATLRSSASAASELTGRRYESRDVITSYVSAAAMMRDPSGMSSSGDAVVAVPVVALVVAVDDVGDGSVALDAAHELGSLLRVELDGLPLLRRELAVGEEDRVGEDELADVVQESGRVDELLLALGKPHHPGHLAAIACDGSGVARGHGVPHGERLHDRGEEAHLQGRQLAGPLAELLAALERRDAGAEAGTGRRTAPRRARPTAPTPIMSVAERGAGREQGGGELRRARGSCRPSAPPAHRTTRASRG